MKVLIVLGIISMTYLLIFALLRSASDFDDQVMEFYKQRNKLKE